MDSLDWFESPPVEQFRATNCLRVTSHSAKQCVEGNNHTNTGESNFSLLQRSLIGTFHHVGEQHLQCYFTEFNFRWKHRKTKDKERSDVLLTGVGGKRLRYGRLDT